MEGSVKKPIMLAVVIICLIAVAVIAGKKWSASKSSGIETIPVGEKIWVKCRNPDCGAEYQMSKREYFKYLQENRDTAMPFQTPALPCKECGEPSIYRAVKCPNCDKVFEYGTLGRGHFADECPDCGYSGTEEKRKARRRERTKTQELE